MATNSYMPINPYGQISVLQLCIAKTEMGTERWTGPYNSAHQVGQDLSGGTDYNMYEYFSQYDLSSIDGAMLILSAKEYLIFKLLQQLLFRIDSR